MKNEQNPPAFHPAAPTHGIDPACCRDIPLDPAPAPKAEPAPAKDPALSKRIAAVG